MLTNNHFTCDTVLQANKATEDARKITNNRREDSDHAQGHEKARPAASHARRWDKGKNNLEKKYQNSALDFVGNFFKSQLSFMKQEQLEN